MKEQELPLRDLKTGVKVTAVIGGAIIESVKPYAKQEAGRRLQKFVSTLRRGKI